MGGGRGTHRRRGVILTDVADELQAGGARDGAVHVAPDRIPVATTVTGHSSNRSGITTRETAAIVQRSRRTRISGTLSLGRTMVWRKPWSVVSVARWKYASSTRAATCSSRPCGPSM